MTPEEIRATVVDHMHEKFREVWTCRSGDVRADRQANRHTNIYAHHITWRIKS